MLSLAQEKKIRAAQTKKGREKNGCVLVEGETLLREAGAHVVLRFERKDTPHFDTLVTTETPQDVAGLATLPNVPLERCLQTKTILLLDGIQDPGNLGTILRSARAFDAAVLLWQCVDPGNAKVIRSSAGAIFHTRWHELSREELDEILTRPPVALYRLEKRPGAIPLDTLDAFDALFIVGSEGTGIKLDVKAPSVMIPHEEQVESLNVSVATSLLLAARWKK